MRSMTFVRSILMAQQQGGDKMKSTSTRISKERPARWYERDRWAYTKDRERIDKLADWIKQVDWKLFCTFTFEKRQFDETADHTFKQFINRLERHLKSDIGYIRGDEKRFSGCGSLHLVVTTTPSLPAQHHYRQPLWSGYGMMWQATAVMLVVPRLSRTMRLETVLATS